jgi:hypothetical protein
MLAFQPGHPFSMLACQGSPRQVWGTGALEETPPMVRSIVHKGECYNISINVLMPGAGGTTATCRECPELRELGDDPDDALRRIREAIERRTK